MGVNVKTAVSRIEEAHEEVLGEGDIDVKE